jgi:hypothetical protein
LIFCFEKAGSLHKWPKLWKEDGCRRPASAPGEGRKKTKSRREEKLLNRFLKLLKNVRCEPEPFSTCSCDFGTKKKNKTPSKWPRILTPAVKEIYTRKRDENGAE